MGTVCPPTVYFETIVYEDALLPILPFDTIHIDEASSVCLDVIEQYGNHAELYLPDVRFKRYAYEDVVNSAHLEHVSTLTFISEQHDCDDFAAYLFGQWAGLAWTNSHALSWFIDENGKFWFIEPQTKKISDKLDSWQGKSLRFLLGR